MRSVMVHLRAVTEPEVAALLDRLYTKRVEYQDWVESGDDRPILYVDFYHDLNTEFEVEAWFALIECLGSEPSVSVVADVSGVYPGDLQVREFVISLLSNFQGIAQDGYTEHCWTLEEVVRGERIEGHPFFDYLGWYEAEATG